MLPCRTIDQRLPSPVITEIIDHSNLFLMYVKLMQNFCLKVIQINKDDNFHENEAQPFITKREDNHKNGSSV